MKRSPLRKVSKKRRDFDAELERMRPLVEARSGDYCEVRDDTYECRRQATVIHHIRGRKRKDSNDLKYLLHVCDGHHRFIHAHPTESYAKGWLLKKEGIT